MKRILRNAGNVVVHSALEDLGGSCHVDSDAICASLAVFEFLASQLWTLFM